jgi:hypothetical protein
MKNIGVSASCNYIVIQISYKKEIDSGKQTRSANKATIPVIISNMYLITYEQLSHDFSHHRIKDF